LSDRSEITRTSPTALFGQNFLKLRSDNMGQEDDDGDTLNEKLIESATKSITKPHDDYQPSPLPPLLLASHTLWASSYASFMYSIARITVFKFQTPVNISFMAAGLTFAIPTAASLLLKLALDYSTTPASDLINTPEIYQDYQHGYRFWLPAAVVGVWTFARRALCEYLFNTVSAPRLPLGMAGPSFSSSSMPALMHPITSAFGVPFIGTSWRHAPAWQSTYVSEFLFPLAFSAITNKNVQMANKALTAINTCLLDVALANLFHLAPSYAPAWICLPAIALLLSQFLIDQSIRSNERDDFSDLPYENDMRHSTQSKWQKMASFIKYALEVEMLF